MMGGENNAPGESGAMPNVLGQLLSLLLSEKAGLGLNGEAAPEPAAAPESKA